MIHTKIQWRKPTRISALVNHVFTHGKSGSGKSNLSEYIVRQFAEKRIAKVVDLYDSGRFENHLYSIPEEDPRFIRLMQERKRGLKPSGVPVEILWFLGSGARSIKKIPKCVNLVVFDGNDLTVSDLAFLMGGGMKRGLMDYMDTKYRDKTGKPMGIFETERQLDAFMGGTSTDKDNLRKFPIAMLASAWRNIKKMRRCGLFSKSTLVKKLDLHASLMDIGTITACCTRLCEDLEEGVSYGLALKKIFLTKKYGYIPHPIVIYIREIHHFFTNPDYALARYYLIKIIREGRDYGITIYADTQTLNDVPPEFRSQFGYLPIMKTDVSEAMKALGIKSVPTEYLKKLSNLQAGYFLLLTGSAWHYVCMAPPAPHMHKRKRLDVLGLLAERVEPTGWNYVEPDTLYDADSTLTEGMDKEEDDNNQDGQKDGVEEAGGDEPGGVENQRAEKPRRADEGPPIPHGCEDIGEEGFQTDTHCD